MWVLYHPHIGRDGSVWFETFPTRKAALAARKRPRLARYTPNPRHIPGCRSTSEGDDDVREGEWSLEGEAMTLAEAMKLAEVFADADSGCPVCVASICKDANSKGFGFKWTFVEGEMMSDNVVDVEEETP